MNLKTIEKKLRECEAKAKKAEQTARGAIEGAARLAVAAVNIRIDQGELLQIAKQETRSEGVAFMSWVKDSTDFDQTSAQHLMRIAAHKEEARMLARENATQNIKRIAEQVPPANQPPRITDAAGDPALNEAGSTARNKNDWHTPSEYIELCRKVMGGIDFDPFSSTTANLTVGATRWLTEADDALVTGWSGPRVFMNPPYSNGMATKSVARFVEQLNVNAFSEAIVLMNAATDTAWFHLASSVSDALCFTSGRIAFCDPGGKKVSGNTKGQVFFYIGDNDQIFRKIFSPYGLILQTGIENGRARRIDSEQIGESAGNDGFGSANVKRLPTTIRGSKEKIEIHGRS